ncbi:MAG: hypothetical protein ABEJ08_01415 [Halobacteriaceae archaeon]
MSAFDRYECTACGDTFEAHPDANATRGPYCSPACEVRGEGLR